MNALSKAALAGVLLLGVAGCSAEAGIVPEASITVTPPVPTVTASIPPRQEVRVTLSPDEIQGGQSRNIRITAYCPPALPGTSYQASAHSDAFTGIVSLLAPAAETPAPSPAPAPRLTGVAVLKASAKAGGYRVEVRCSATNDIGNARLQVLRSGNTADETRFPTKAPGAGGGGTAAGGPADESGVPVAPFAVGLLAAAGLGIAVARRRARG
ncbi:hypothetical protein GT755_28205 [Herbidospora sp. NEAU-GS84]|uniref:Gram-positive cocci surface proteins LPxTG domain-containing protein n=1 Tax=Herbidospora solisilvae TaxID=2696284 RepID=A0A7C9N5V1_9ACTN|nr:hypothetical protein [Herbidospora solisilvae]NAS25554.1 hypothetical protein [Herbidospora solisilvae]